MTTTLMAQVAPQRSTQYMSLATALAPVELTLSPLGSSLRSIDFVELGGQTYCQCQLERPPEKAHIDELGMLAMTRAFFWYYESLGEYSGPWLQPLETDFQPSLPPDVVMTRRYRGKTNELFTHFLCNLARFSSNFTAAPWNTLRVLDPLAGGGTTLFTALMLGAQVAGVEKNSKDVQLTAAFLKQYTQAQKITCAVKEERFKKLGRRWWFTLGDNLQQCILAAGDTAKSDALIAGFKKPHLIVTDLPYGIQHQGKLVELLTTALPVWKSLLVDGGAMVMAWESTRFARDEMIALVESVSGLRVLNQSPYNMLAHRVDRVIKQRDVIVARPK